MSLHDIELSTIIQQMTPISSVSPTNLQKRIADFHAAVRLVQRSMSDQPGKELVTTPITQTLLYKWLSTMGLLERGEQHDGKVFWQLSCGISGCAFPAPEDALRSLANSVAAWPFEEIAGWWEQVLAHHVAEQRTLQPLVQRELLEVQDHGYNACYVELETHLDRCFSKVTDIAEIGSYQFAVKVDKLKLAGDVRSWRWDALQSLLDKIYADPIASEKWTVYLERSA